MGHAAYMRGSAAISSQIDRDRRPVEFDIMDRLNAEPKFPGAPVPFDDVHFVPGHGGIWAECPTTGFGYHYGRLSDAIRSWRVEIVGYVSETNTWVGRPVQPESHA